MQEEMPRILLADDHELVAAGIRRLLQPHFQIIATVADGRQLLEVAREKRPDVILADISMPELDGIDATRQLRQTVPNARVIILTMHDDAGHAKAAFEAGAMGYLVKSSAPAELTQAIRDVLAGRRYMTPVVAGKIMGDLSEPRIPEAPSPLTPREREISGLVAQGLENYEIAARLCIAEVTVRTHFQRIMRKLGLRNRVELTRYAFANGWRSPDGNDRDLA